MGNIYQNDANKYTRNDRGTPAGKRPISGSAVARIVIWSIVFFLLVGVFSVALLGDFLGSVIRSGGRIRLNGWDFDDDDYVIGSGSVRSTVREISVDWVAGSVTLEATDGDEIRITEDYDGSRDADRMRWCVDEGELSVKYCKPSLKVSLLRDEESVSKNLTIAIPYSMLNGIDEIRISTVSADQHIRVSAEELKLETVSGVIKAAGDYRTAEIETVSGKVCVDGTLQRGSFDGVSAHVELNLREQADRVSMDTVSGNLRVLLPKNTTGFRVSSDSFMDDVTVHGFALERRGSAWGDGRMQIDLDGVSGKLTIEQGAD